MEHTIQVEEGKGGKGKGKEDRRQVCLIWRYPLWSFRITIKPGGTLFVKTASVKHLDPPAKTFD